MGLKLNLDGIQMDFEITGYHKPSNENWDEEWCKVNLILRSEPWLNYKLENSEILLCCEVDELIPILTDWREGKLNEKTRLSFIEPDLELILYPEKKDCHPSLLDIIVNFWDKGELTANYLSLTMDILNASNLLNYLRHIQSESEKEYEPFTLDGLTREQIDIELQKGFDDMKAGRGYSVTEAMEIIREKYGLPQLTDDEKVEIVSRETLKRNLAAYKRLAE